jgi:hypothetical protein
VIVSLTILIPMDYQIANGLSAYQAGFRLIPLTIGAAIGSFAAGQFVTHAGHYRVCPLFGNALAMIACGALAYRGLGEASALDAGITMLLGFAIGCNFSPLSVAVQNTLDSDDTGIGMSCIMFFQLLGGAFGVALLSTVFITRLNAATMSLPGHAMLGSNPGAELLNLDDPAHELPRRCFMACRPQSITRFRMSS